MKKASVLCLVALGIVLIFVHTNCSPAATGTITFFVGGAPAELDFWQKLVSDFERTSGIKVDIIRQPTDSDLRRQGLITPLRAHQPVPDVFLMDVAWLAQFAASDWLEPLESFMEDSSLSLDDFLPAVVQSVDIYNSRVVALPVYVDGGLLYYRKDLLEKYGFSSPPDTWGELVLQARIVQEQERKHDRNFYGFVWQGAQYEGLICTWLEFAASGGGGITIDNSVISIDTPANIKATQFMYQLVHTYKISPPNTYTQMKEEQVRTYFQQGLALFERNWPYAWALHQRPDSPIKGKIGIAPLPHFDGGHSVSTLGGWHIGISKYSDMKPQSFKFIEFVCSFQTQKRLALKLGWNPGRKDVYTAKDVAEYLPHFILLSDIFENLYPRPIVPYYTLLSAVIQRHISTVLSGREDAAKALSQAQIELEQIVRKYGSGQKF